MKFIPIDASDCILWRLDYWLWNEINPDTRTFYGKPMSSYWTFLIGDPDDSDPTSDLMWRIKRNERVWVKETDYLRKTTVIKEIL